MIFIFTYGKWGSELYGTAKMLEAAKEKAKTASQRYPEDEFSVELEPGGFYNPLFKNGEQIGGR